MGMRQVLRSLLALAGVALFIPPVPAWTFSEIKDKFVVDGAVDATIIVGKYDPASVGAEAVKLALAFKDLVKVPTTAEAGKVVIEKGVEVVGAAKLWTDTDKIYLGEAINQGGVDALKEGDLAILETKTVTDKDAKDHKLKFFIKPLSGGTTTFAFNDETKYYGVVLEVSDDVLQLEVVFEPALNFTKMTGKEITLFGKKFVVTANEDEIDSDTLVLFEKGKPIEVYKDEPKEIEIEGKTYKAEITGWSETGDTVYLKLTDLETGVSQTKGVKTDQSAEYNYDDLGIKVFVKDAKVMKTGAEEYSVYVVIWQGTNKYIFDGAYVYKGEVESANKIKGLSIDTTNLNYKSCASLIIKFDPREVREDLPDWEESRIKPGEEVEVPLFGIKLVYEGPSEDLKADTKDKVAVKSDGKTKLYIEYGGKRLYFAKWEDDGTTGEIDSGEIKAKDDEGNDWVFIEGSKVTVSDEEEVTFYTVANPGKIDDARIIKVKFKDLSTDGTTDNEIKIYDALTGELLAEAEDIGTGTNAKSVYIGTKAYKVDFDDKDTSDGELKILYDADSATAVFPVVKLDNGELLAISKSVTITDSDTGAGSGHMVKVLLPTGTIYLDYDGTNNHYEVYASDGTTLLANVTTAADVIDVGGVKYYVNKGASAGDFEVAIEEDQDDSSANGQKTVAVTVIEPESDGTYAGAFVIRPIASGEVNGANPKELEATIKYPDARATDSDAHKSYYYTTWGTFGELYTPEEGTNTVTLYVPEEKVYYKALISPTEAAAEAVTVEYGVGEEIPGVGTVKGFTGVEAYTVGPVTLEVKTEEIATKPMIVLGTYLGNSIALQFLGNDTVAPGEPLVKLTDHEGTPVVLITGVTSEDVIKAIDWFAGVITAVPEEFGNVTKAKFTAGAWAPVAE